MTLEDLRVAVREDVRAAIRELRTPPCPLLNAKQAGERLNVPASWLLAQARKERFR